MPPVSDGTCVAWKREANVDDLRNGAACVGAILHTVPAALNDNRLDRELPSSQA